MQNQAGHGKDEDTAHNQHFHRSLGRPPRRYGRGEKPYRAGNQLAYESTLENRSHIPLCISDRHNAAMLAQIPYRGQLLGRVHISSSKVGYRKSAAIRVQPESTYSITPNDLPEPTLPLRAQDSCCGQRICEALMKVLHQHQITRFQPLRIDEVLSIR